ncbi:MAG TPA: uroporphyrinogen decarboxylase family protein [Candidatus Bathyarchaeia archaeon]|nr:uroporphyrinogen decarboxylase family protein [Candidatus Bathyarchaeia archaeon]
MAYHGVMDDIRRAIAMQRPERLPVFLCSEEFDVRVCGSRYDRYNSDSNEMARVQIEAVERFDYDWAWLQVDDCIEFEPLGVDVKGSGDILPATCGYLPATDAALDDLRRHAYRIEGRMRVLLDAITMVKSHFGDTVCVVGRTAAPFSSATLAFGISNILTLMYEQPDFVVEAAKFFEHYQTEFGLDQIKAGADAIWLGDCNASGHLISPDNYAQFAMEPARRVSAAYKEAGTVVIYHASEENPAMVDLQAEAGFSILSIGPGLDILEARSITGNRVCLCGNVDPIRILQNGTPDQVRQEVHRIVTHLTPHGGHLLNSGEMIPRDTPEQNIQAYIESARKVGTNVLARAI